MTHLIGTEENRLQVPGVAPWQSSQIVKALGCNPRIPGANPGSVFFISDH